MTKKELKEKLKLLNLKDKKQRNSVVCSLIGHSMIVTTFFGYVYCGRCEAQIGDTLASVFDTSNCVIIGHCCDKCKENYKNLTWKDKLYCPNPFK
jgi:hypothetical protein